MSQAGPTLVFVRHFALLLREHESARVVEEIVARRGMPDPLTAPVDTRISLEDEAAFVEMACEVTGRPDFGFECGLTYETAGTLPEYLFKHSPTLREGINLGIKYIQTAFPGITYRLDEGGNAASLQLILTDPSLHNYPRYIEAGFAGLTGQIRAFTKLAFHPDKISFTHRRTPASQKVRSRFGCAVEFGVERTEMLFSPAILDTPMLDRDDVLNGILMAEGRARLEKLKQPEPKLPEKVELLLLAGFPDDMPTLDDVARSLALSRRTLSRRLQEDGVSFKLIRNHARMRLAKRELRDSDTPVGELAWRLGYASQAAFSTAFRRETGQTPSAFRQTAQQSYLGAAGTT